MFDPGAAKARQAAPSASRNIVSWVREEMPAAIKASLARDPSAVMVNVREVACGDPSCSPIDTVLAFVFANGRRAMTGIPAEMAQVMREDVARAIGDLEPELTAAHEDRDYVPPGAMPPLSVEADAALDRLRAALRRELVGLSAGDVVGICASLIDTLEQIEEDQLRQAEALPPGGGLPLPGGAGLQPPPLETVLPGGGVAGLVAGLPGAGGGQSSTGAPTSSAASLPGIATAAGSSSSSSSGGAPGGPAAAAAAAAIPPGRARGSSVLAATTGTAQQRGLFSAPGAPFGDPAAKILSASQKNDVEAVARCVDEGISPSYANTLGQTPLHIASMWGNVEVAEYLVAAGADIHAVNQLSSGTPLHVAASSTKDPRGRLACVKILLDAGADATRRDADGLVPWQKVSRVGAREDPDAEPAAQREMREMLRALADSRAAQATAATSLSSNGAAGPPRPQATTTTRR